MRTSKQKDSLLENYIGYSAVDLPVPGPSEPLRFVPDVKIGDWLPIGQVTFGVGLIITVWSYVDRLNICLMASKRVVSERGKFLSHINPAYQQYVPMEEGRS